MASQQTLTDETNSKKKEVVGDDSTFKVLLLVVGLLLIVVAGLMLANTYVTRKHLQTNMVEHAQIRNAIDQ